MLRSVDYTENEMLILDCILYYPEKRPGSRNGVEGWVWLETVQSSDAIVVRIRTSPGRRGSYTDRWGNHMVSGVEGKTGD